MRLAVAGYRGKGPSRLVSQANLRWLWSTDNNTTNKWLVEDPVNIFQRSGWQVKGL
jgi:hypothetical protein